ncbi:MAG: dienelactone hydrolase family protein [Bacteroidetes bacterium]|nr:dienelactone hydrolase family protein [Bacteroidota bacterium]
MSTGLEYKYLPCSLTSNAAPVVVFFHGRGTDEGDLLSLSPYFNSQFHIFSLRAPFPFEFGGYTWCVVEEDGTIDRAQLRESRQRVVQFFSYLQSCDNVDSRNVFFFGFSLGALMVLDITLHTDILLAGIVAHSGFYGEDLIDTSLRKGPYPPILLLHGINDSIVPISLGRETLRFLSSKTNSVVLREYPIEHTISDESLHDSIQWIQQHIVQ